MSENKGVFEEGTERLLNLLHSQLYRRFEKQDQRSLSNEKPFGKTERHKRNWESLRLF